MTTQAQVTQMIQAGALKVEDFLAYTGWDPVVSASRMRVALDFFQRTVPSEVLTRVESDPSPWALPRGELGKPRPPTLRLTQWMQAIDFRRPVDRTSLPPGQRLRAFWTRSGGSVGRWFTKLDAKQKTLAIPRNQHVPVVFELLGPTQGLLSTVGDAYVDWARNAPVDAAAPEYRHGGGVQIFIWQAEHCLRQVKN